MGRDREAGVDSRIMHSMVMSDKDSPGTLYPFKTGRCTKLPGREHPRHSINSRPSSSQSPTRHLLGVFGCPLIKNSTVSNPTQHCVCREAGEGDVQERTAVSPGEVCRPPHPTPPSKSFLSPTWRAARTEKKTQPWEVTETPTAGWAGQSAMPSLLCASVSLCVKSGE